MPYAQYHQDWLEHDGKRVEIDGMSYIIKVSTWLNMNRDELIMVSAVPTLPTRRTEYYQEHKRKLGDDWSVDVLSMDVEDEAKLLVSLDPRYGLPKLAKGGE